MTMVSFPAYRLHEVGRVEANDAMVALLVGGRLSNHMLSLMEGSDSYLTEVFPQLPGVARLHVPIPKARSLLEDSERHLARMAIPYSVSIHEDYLNRCVDMLCVAKGDPPSAVSFHKRKLGNIYATLGKLGLPAVSAGDGNLFELVRRIRNQIVHETAQVGDVLSHYRSDPAIGPAWTVLAKRDLDMSEDGKYLRIEASELFGCLAILKKLADQLNLSLQSTLNLEAWVAIAVAAFSRAFKPGNPNQTARRLLGYVRHNYGALELPEGLVVSEAVKQGLRLS
jgi:hypothetical protein